MKKLNIFLTIVSILFLFACSKDKQNSIKIFNNIEFILTEGEIISELDSFIAEEYKSAILNPNLDFPLFRNIEHSDYQIFIGLPFNVQDENIFDVDFYIENNIEFITDNKEYLYLYHSEGEIIFVELFKKMNNSYFHILSKTSNPDVVSSVLNFENLSERLKLK